MALILKNEQVTKNIFLVKVSEKNTANAGQFYMLKASDTLDPYLPRPISVHDAGSDYLTFLYQVKGHGTQLLSEMKEGDNLNLDGPYGNGFDFEDKDTTFIGGGIGSAPIYYAVKSFKEKFPNRIARVYLGFTDEAHRTNEFEAIADSFSYKVGGIITEDVDYIKDDLFITCGPEIMMKDVYLRALKAGENKTVLVSLESHMACGVGACRGCSRKMKSGMTRVCSEGPVFDAAEVFYE